MPFSLDLHRRCNVALWGVLFVWLALGSVAPAQAGLFDISPDKERRMGDEAARAVESQTRIVTGPVADWVKRVGSRLAAASSPDFQYSFQVIDSPEINAFALPGGYIYVYTGLRKVAQTDDELAAVLAHEITHSEQHHYARQYKKATKRGALLGILSIVAGLPNIAQNVLGILDYSMTQKYSRSQESESDRMGMERMARAGFNPQGMVSLLEKMAKESPDTSRLDRWFGSHPDGPGRVRDAQQSLRQMRGINAALNAMDKPDAATVSATVPSEAPIAEPIPSPSTTPVKPDAGPLDSAPDSDVE